jgi:hypothetical protein
LTDRFTFNCGHSPGTAKIGGSCPFPAGRLSRIEEPPPGDFATESEANMTNLKRMTIGLLTAVAILLLLDLLPSLVPDRYAALQLFDHFYVWPGVGGLVGMFIAAFGGAYVSKVPFVIPAAALAVAGWSFVVYLLNSIAAAAGHGDILSVASVNLLGLVFGIVGAVLGANLGARMAPNFSPAVN